MSQWIIPMTILNVNVYLNASVVLASEFRKKKDHVSFHCFFFWYDSEQKLKVEQMRTNE